jgi:hypothetical protein
MNAPDTNLGVGAAEDIRTSPLSADTKENAAGRRESAMIATQLETAGACAGTGNAAALGAADWLCLAAAR